MWTAPAGAKLTTATPVTLTYDNGAGLVFTRTIAVDDNYMFTVTDSGRQQGRRAGHAHPLRAGDAPRRAAHRPATTSSMRA